MYTIISVNIRQSESYNYKVTLEALFSISEKRKILNLCEPKFWNNVFFFYVFVEYIWQASSQTFGRNGNTNKCSIILVAFCMRQIPTLCEDSWHNYYSYTGGQHIARTDRYSSHSFYLLKTQTPPMFSLMWNYKYFCIFSSHWGFLVF